MTATETIPRPDTCNHVGFKYTAIGGHQMCEMCARIEAKWAECTAWGCDELVPPEQRRCQAHGAETVVECEDCEGIGEVEVDCEECDGLGRLTAPCLTCDGEGELDEAVV